MNLEKPDPPNAKHVCFRCSSVLGKIRWDAVTWEAKIVVVCPSCSQAYARVRQQEKQ